MPFTNICLDNCKINCVSFATRGTRECAGADAGAMDAKMEEGQPSASASLSATNKVERFVGLVRTAKTDDEVVELIMAATSEPGVIAFQELIELPQVQSLQNSANSSCKAAYRLLLVFAYGTWSSYLREQAQLPSVSPDHQLKLKQLSVITLAEKSKIFTLQC